MSRSSALARSRFGCARAYAPALLGRWVRPPVQFVIITVGRTGSELLVSLLDSHPGIVCDSEILAESPPFPASYVRAKTALARFHGAEVYGWKLLTGQFRNIGTVGFGDSRKFVHRLYRDGFQIIHVERRDHLQQAMSWYRAQQNGYHQNQGAAVSFAPDTIDPTTLLWATFANDEASEFLKGILAPLPHLHLVYEDDLQDETRHQATADRICRFLDVAPAPVRSDLLKVTPQETRDMVTNWDEISALFRQSRYADLVEEGAQRAEPTAANRRT
jgi:hypothetical protein